MTVTTGVAEKTFGFPLGRGWLVRWANAGRVVPAEVTAAGHYLWDLEDLARQFEANSPASNRKSDIPGTS
jgi:hypothetical protein